MRGPTIKKTYRLPAPRSRVFNAWLSDKHCVAPVVRMHVDREAGGSICLYLGDESGGGRMEGRFLEFRDCDRLKYTWQWEGSAESSIVDVRFADAGEDTIVTLTHAGIDSQDSADRHADGWDAYIDGLSRSLGGS